MKNKNILQETKDIVNDMKFFDYARLPNDLISTIGFFIEKIEDRAKWSRLCKRNYAFFQKNLNPLSIADQILKSDLSFGEIDLCRKILMYYKRNASYIPEFKVIENLKNTCPNEIEGKATWLYIKGKDLSPENPTLLLNIYLTTLLFHSLKLNKLPHMATVFIQKLCQSFLTEKELTEDNYYQKEFNFHKEEIYTQKIIDLIDDFIHRCTSIQITPYMSACLAQGFLHLTSELQMTELIKNEFHKINNTLATLRICLSEPEKFILSFIDGKNINEYSLSYNQFKTLLCDKYETVNYICNGKIDKNFDITKLDIFSIKMKIEYRKHYELSVDKRKADVEINDTEEDVHPAKRIKHI